MKLKTFSRYQLYVIVLFMTVGITFYNSVNHGYNMDDFLVTKNHPLTSNKKLHEITNIFTSAYYTDNMGYKYGYRPITLVSFFIENYCFGEHANTSHLINLILYGLVVFLLFKLITSWPIPNAQTTALVACLFFAVHPIHTEVVDSIKNRDELLALFFALLSFIQASKFKGDNYGRLFATMCFFTLSLLSKKSTLPLAYVMPVSMMLLDKKSIKPVIYATIALVVPATVIGADFNLSKLLLPVVISGLFILGILVYYHVAKIKHLFLTIPFHRIPIKWILAIVCLLLTALFIHNNNYIILGLSIPIYLYLFNKDRFLTLELVSLAFGLIGLLNNHYYMGLIAVFTSINLIIEQHKLGKKPWLALALTTFAVSALFYSNTYYLASTFYVASIFMFFIALPKKPLVSILTCLCHLTITIASKEIPQTGIIMMLTLLANYSENSTPFKLQKYVGTFTLAVVLIIGLIPYLNLDDTKTIIIVNNQNTPIYSENTSLNNTAISEGRELLYIENTLVEPHTKEEFLFTGLETLFEYTRLLIYPHELGFYYGYSYLKTANASSIKGWISLAFYALLIVFALYQNKRNPMITLGVFWYISCILLFSNWVELVAGMVGERLSFSASAGFAILFASILIWIKPNLFQSKISFLELALPVVLILFSIKTLARNEDWKTPISLMSNDIINLSNSAQANNIYASALMEKATQTMDVNEQKQHIDKAIFHFKQATAIYPKFFNAYIDLGRVYVMIGDLPNARDQYQKAYEIDSNSTLALEELVKIYFDLQDTEKLIFYSNIYLNKDPYNEKIYELVSHHLFTKKDDVRASVFTSRGLVVFPNNPILGSIQKSMEATITNSPN